MQGFQTFAAWLRAAPEEWFADFLGTRRDLVRSDTDSLTRLAGLACTRQAVAVGLEALDCAGLGTALRAARAARRGPVIPADELSADAPTLRKLMLLGLLWPAGPLPEHCDPAEAEAFGFQSEAITLLPTTAAQTAEPPAWTERTRPGPPRRTAVAAGILRNAEAAAAASAGAVIIATVRALGARAPSQLVSGGIGNRDVLRLASTLRLGTHETLLCIELAGALGLVGVDADDIDPVWLPTSAYDTAVRADRGAFHSDIVTAWLRLGTDIAHLFPGRTPRGDSIRALTSAVRPQSANPYGGHPTALPAVRFARFRLLTALAELTAEGEALSVDDLIAHLEWEHPLTPSANPDSLRLMLSEAEFLGLAASDLTAAGHIALTPLGRMLAEHLRASMGAHTAPLGYAPAAVGTPEGFAEAVGELLPDYAQTAVLQSDLTAIAAGPLHPEVAERLESIADVETRGQGTVYRLSEASIERALQAGLSREDICGILTTCSHTPIPQPLEFLIDSVAARMHRTRVAAARSVVIVDDPDDLTALLAEPLLVPAGLKRASQTVAVADVTADRLRMLLEAAGSPTLTAAGPSRPRRAPRPESAKLSRRSTRLDGEEFAGFAARVRSTAAPAEASAASTASRLRDAIDRAEPVTVTLAGRTGEARSFTMVPTALGGGRVRGLRDGSEVTAALARIIRVEGAGAGGGTA